MTGYTGYAHGISSGTYGPHPGPSDVPRMDAWHDESGLLQHLVAWLPERQLSGWKTPPSECWVPAANEKPDDFVAAFERYWIDPYDRCAAESIFMAFVRLLSKVAFDLSHTLSDFAYNDYRWHGGADLFSVMLRKWWTTIWHGKLHGHKFNGKEWPTKPSELLSAVKQYCSRIAKNEGLDFARNRDLDSSFANGTEIEANRERRINENARFLVRSTDDQVADNEIENLTKSIISEVCREPHDRLILRLKAEGKLTEEQIGQQCGLSHDGVNRCIRRLRIAIQTRLGIEATTDEQNKRASAIHDADVPWFLLEALSISDSQSAGKAA